jgi:hypothetical protein
MDEEIFDCTSLSISYQATGLANISFTAYRPAGTGPPYVAGGPAFRLCAGGVLFKGWVMDQTIVPSNESSMLEWRVTAVAVGCRDASCGKPC